MSRFAPAGIVVLFVLTPGLAAADVVELPSPAARDAQSPNLAAARDGVVMTWLEPGRSGGHRLRFARLLDGRWTAAVTIAESERIVVNWADVPSAVELDDGGLVAHWAEERAGHAYDVVLGRSRDRGATWTRIGLAHDDGTATEHGFVSLLADGPSALAVWLDGRETGGGGHQHQGAMTLRAAAVGEKVTGAAVVDDRVCDCCGTAAAMTARGPIVAYRDRAAGEIRDISVARRAGGRWLPGRPVHRDGWRVPGCPVNGPAMAARGRDVALAWYTYAGSRSRVRLAFSRDAGATFARPIEVDVERGRTAPIGRVDLALLSSGEVAVVWMASDREDATILARRVARDGRQGAPVVVASSRSDRESGFPQLVPAGDDLILAWTSRGDQTGPGVRTARLPAASLPAARRPAVESVAAPAPVAVAPAVAVETLDGRPASLTDLRGQPVLVNFWATWCQPCRMELPELTALDGRYRARGLQVVGVSVDRERSPAQIRAFLARGKPTHHQWLDRHESLAGAMAVGVLPATFLIDARGTVVWRATGAITATDAALVARIESLLPRGGDRK